MSHFENDPPSEDPINLGAIGFNFEGVETEDFTPEDEVLIREFSVPVRRPRSLMGEVTADFQRRLDIMRLEDPGAANIFRVRKLEKLYLHMRPYALEDIHYSAYDYVKRMSPNIPYIAIRFRDVLEVMPQEETQIEVLQEKQTFEAYGFLVDLGISNKDLTLLAHGSDNQQFLLRSLQRILKEGYLSTFIEKLPRESQERGAKKPVAFVEAAERACRIINRVYQTHMNNPPSFGGHDARLWHELERRSLERAMSFAHPLFGLETIENHNHIK
jgi:hypothetical protein